VNDKPDKTAKQRIDRSALHITIASTVVAVIAAAAALWSGYEAHKTRTNDERPFIAVDTTYAGQPPYYENYQSKIVAFGKSPARKISVTCDFVLDDESESEEWNPTKDYSSAQYPYLLPGRSITLFCGTLHGTPNDGNLMTEFGVVSYYDDNNTYYQTPFCSHMTPLVKSPIAIEPCSKSHGLPELK